MKSGIQSAEKAKENSHHEGCLPSGPDERGADSGQRSSQRSNRRTRGLQFQKTKRTQIFSNEGKITSIEWYSVK